MSRQIGLGSGTALQQRRDPHKNELARKHACRLRTDCVGASKQRKPMTRCAHIVMTAALCGLSSTTFACDCIYAPDELLDRARVIFVARVTSIERVEGANGVTMKGNFDATHVLKGSPDGIPLLTSTSAFCSVPMSVGEYYLVVSDGSGHMEVCLGTFRIDRSVTTVETVVRETQEDMTCTSPDSKKRREGDGSILSLDQVTERSMKVGCDGL